MTRPSPTTLLAASALCRRSMNTPIGPLELVAGPAGLRAVLWPGEDGSRVARAVGQAVPRAGDGPERAGGEWTEVESGVSRGAAPEGAAAGAGGAAPEVSSAARGGAGTEVASAVLGGAAPEGAAAGAGGAAPEVASAIRGGAAPEMESGVSGGAAPEVAAAGARWDPADLLRAEEHLDAAQTQLEEYFSGSRREFDLALDPVGTQFQRRAWMALRTIPYGSTISYGEQAAELGEPGAARAVGAANGRNPLSIVVPCHRVVAASGALTGFAGGLGTKAWLLDHERAVLAGG